MWVLACLFVVKAAQKRELEMLEAVKWWVVRKGVACVVTSFGYRLSLLRKLSGL
jgi:hypothetical protein